MTRKPIVIDQSAFNQGPNAMYTPIIEESDVMATLVAVRPHGVLDARATPADSVSWWDGGDVAQTITCTSNSQRMPDSGNFHGVVGNFSKGTPSVAGTLGSRTGSGGGFSTDFETDGGLVPCGLFQTVVGTDLYNVAITGDVAATLGRAGSPTTEIGPTVMGFFSNMSEPSVMFDVSPAVKVGTSSTSGCPPAVARILRTEANASEDGTSCGTRLTPTEMTVRRLTPRECERLQGFPDDWTLVPYRNKPAADGPRYKAIGNSMAVNVMRWIGMRIQANH